MRWPWQRRGRGRHAAVPSQRRWAEPALPPVRVAEPTTDPSIAGASTSEPPTEVRLGFADGSELALHPADPRAHALRAVADLLIGGAVR